MRMKKNLPLDYKHKKGSLSKTSFLIKSDSVGIRTLDPQIRNLLLYPAELRNHPI